MKYAVETGLGAIIYIYIYIPIFIKFGPDIQKLLEKYTDM
jgi:hypothetical protein